MYLPVIRYRCLQKQEVHVFFVDTWNNYGHSYTRGALIKKGTIIFKAMITYAIRNQYSKDNCNIIVRSFLRTSCCYDHSLARCAIIPKRYLKKT